MKKLLTAALLCLALKASAIPYFDTHFELNGWSLVGYMAVTDPINSSPVTYYMNGHLLGTLSGTATPSDQSHVLWFVDPVPPGSTIFNWGVNIPSAFYDGQTYTGKSFTLTLPETPFVPAPDSGSSVFLLAACCGLLGWVKIHWGRVRV